MTHVSEQPRLRALLEAGIALTSELSLDAVLERLIETGARLTSARYAALGVIDPTGTGLERFVTYGIDEGTATTIGDPPHGRGILGVLIREARPLRLHDLTEDPRSVGFPPGHPPMRTFLGVPVVLRGVAFGNLYLTEKEGGDFTDEDEELVTMLAAQAAVAVENARLYESTTRWSRQLESLNEIGNALVSEVDLPALLELIAARLRELVHARLVVISLPDGAGQLRVESASGAGEEEVLGMTVDIATSKLGRVFERRRSERVDSLVDDPEVDQHRRPPAAREHRAVRPARRPRPRDRRPERGGQARGRSAVQRRRPAARGGIRLARVHRGRSLGASHAGRSPPRRGSAGARAAQAGARAP